MSVWKHKSLSCLCVCFSVALTTSVQGITIDVKSNAGHLYFALKTWEREQKRKKSQRHRWYLKKGKGRILEGDKEKKDFFWESWIGLNLYCD